MISLIDLHAYLRFKACQDHEVISTSAFTCFFHPTSADEESNYALPDVCEGRDLQTDLRDLLSLFGERARTPTLQFIEELFPHLVPLLISSGWSEQTRSPVMIYTPEISRPVPEIVGLTITTLSSSSSVEAIREGLDTNALGFDPQAERSTIQEAEEFRQTLTLSRAFTASLHGQPVGAGMFTEISNGWTELLGITTLEPFRRQGIAATLTASMTQHALQQGATHIFLMAANEQAGRVYERVGFCSAATSVVYALSASPSNEEP